LECIEGLEEFKHDERIPTPEIGVEPDAEIYFRRRQLTKRHSLSESPEPTYSRFDHMSNDLDDEQAASRTFPDLPLHTHDDIPTTSSSIKQMAYFRNLTRSLSVSLTTLSEHAQVNGVNTADAGRKLRALKNKIGDLKADFDIAEKSRIQIEQWESGAVQDAVSSSCPDFDDVGPKLRSSISASEALHSKRRRAAHRRIDGRRVVEEELNGFKSALADAAMKTRAIMTR